MKIIKLKLKSICDDTVRKKINYFVKLENYLTSITSLFLKSYLLFSLNQNNFPKVDLNTISTAYNVIIFNHNKSKKRGKKLSTNSNLFDLMDSYYKNEFINHATIRNDLEFHNMSHIIRASATQLLTCYENNILLNYITYINKFVNYSFINSNLNKSEKDNIRIEIKKVKSDLINNETKSDVKYHNWIKENRNKLIPNEITSQKEILNKLKTDPIIFHKYMIFMNSKFEEWNKKTLQQFPLRKQIGNKHIQIDTQAIIDMLVDKNFNYNYIDIFNKSFEKINNKLDLFAPKLKKDNKDKKNKNKTIDEKKELNDIKKNIWLSFFNLKQKYLSNGNYQFNNSIRTDGYSVSICLDSESENLSKKKNLNIDSFQYLEDIDNETLEKIKKTNIIGVDPGKKNIFQMIDENGNKLSYSAIQRKRELKVDELNKKLNKILLKEKFQDNSRSNQLNIFNKYVENKTKIISNNLEKLSKNIFKNISFNRYVLKRKQEDNMINKIKNKFGNNITLCYGNWSFSKQMKNFIPTPNIGLKKRLGKDFKIYTIDEYNTSKKCFGCGSDNENKIKIKDPKVNQKEKKRKRKCKYQGINYVKLEKENEIRKEIYAHSLLCCSNKKCNKVWSRDINGSLNILKIGLSIINKKDRPTELQRTKIIS
jgi:hypothetical protein